MKIFGAQGHKEECSEPGPPCVGLAEEEARQLKALGAGAMQPGYSSPQESPHHSVCRAESEGVDTCDLLTQKSYLVSNTSQTKGKRKKKKKIENINKTDSKCLFDLLALSENIHAFVTQTTDRQGKEYSGEGAAIGTGLERVRNSVSSV